MIFVVDLNNKLKVILNKYSSSHGPVIIHSASTKVLVLIVWVDAYAIQPHNIFLVNFVDLVILAREVPQHLDHFPFNLEARLFCHQR